MSDADDFVDALRSIDGQVLVPRHCKGHMRDMRIRGLVELTDGSVWRLTDEGRRRAYPKYGALRVTRERVQDAINNEGGGWRASVVLHKTQTARIALRDAWYTPDFAKTITRAR